MWEGRVGGVCGVVVVEGTRERTRVGVALRTVEVGVAEVADHIVRAACRREDSLV